MKQIYCLRNTAELCLIVSAIAITLTACGGGGGGTSTPNTPALPNTPAVSTNEVEIALSDGIYHLWGFGYILANVPQVFISKTGSPSGPSNAMGWSVTKILGAVSSSETEPRFEDAVRMTVSSTSPYWWWSFPASSVQATLTTPYASSPTWTMTLNQQDISGLTVTSQIKRGDGSLLPPTLANASAVFPVSSIAYTATFTAAKPLIVTGWTLRGGSYGIEPIQSEAAMFGAGWCHEIADQTYRLGVQINAANTITLFNVSTPTCTFSGLTPIATGSWIKETGSNGDIIYRFTYPSSVTADPAWASAFTNSYSPTTNKTPDLIINPANSTNFSTAFDVPVGSTYTTLQPFFNTAALPALRSAAGI